jgi:flagellar basal-body rod protein FlgB
MVPTDVGLFKLFSAHMRWLGQREVVLGQNIANADTPDYRPHDLRARDFERLAAGVRAAGARLPVRATDPGHLDGQPALRLGLESQEQRHTFEVSPDGNAVVLEEQMAKMAETALAYQTTSNLYQKYLGMIRTALGTQS